MIEQRHADGPSNLAIAIPLATWLVLYFAIRFYLESDAVIDGSVRLALAFLPTPLFALFLWKFIQGLRSADELERRIQLEALAVAFPLGLLLLATLALVQRAVPLDPENWSYGHVWQIFAMLYLLGLVLARRRYA